MKNEIKITRQRGFPQILNDHGLEIPIRAKTVFNKLTVNLTLIEPDCSVGAKVPSPQEIPTPPAENKSEKISIECIRDAATYISLPKKSQEVLAQGKNNTITVEAASFPETKICDLT